MQRGQTERASMGQLVPCQLSFRGNTFAISPKLCAAHAQHCPRARSFEVAVSIHTNPNSSSVDTLLMHAKHRFSNSPNRAVILPYPHNRRMKKVIRGSFLLMVNRAVGISIERKISQEEYYYRGLCFRWYIYANYMQIRHGPFDFWHVASNSFML